MDLIRFRIIGHPAIPNTPWLKVGKGLNIIKAVDAERAKSLLKMLQAINPPYDFRQIDPFQDLPQFISGNPHPRKIIPSKKTAAIAIFTAPISLVKELVAIDPAFFEINQIEFGRRRDHSRWINFIELSNATRWSEIESGIRGMLSRVGPDAVSAVERFQNTVAHLCSADRIKGKTAVDLRERLEELQPFLLGSDQAHLQQCVNAVGRAEHFQQAKEIVEDRIPLFLSVTSSLSGCPFNKTDNTLSDAVNSALFDLLIKPQRGKDHADEVSLQQRLQQVNLNLRTKNSVLTPHFRLEGSSIVLEGMQNSAAISLAELQPIYRLEVLLPALAALHRELYGNDPIFLLDISEIQFKRQELNDLSRLLLGYSAKGQILVVPDSSFLALCLDTASNNERHPATIIELLQ